MNKGIVNRLAALAAIAALPMQVSAWSALSPLAAVAVVAATPSAGHAQWWKNVDGCLVFEHRGMKGAEFVVDDTLTYSYVGDKWNDRISSVVCEVYCRLTVWEHRDYKGASKTFGPDVMYVGSAWNDRISSMEANCEE